MKIVVISGGFGQQNLQALPWKYAYEISKYLAQKKHNVYILTDSSKSCSINYNKYRIPIIGYGASLPLLNRNKTLLKTLNLIKPDAVYYFSSPIGDFKLKYLKLKVPIILHVSHSIQGVSTYLRANPTLIGISELLQGKLIADSYGLSRIFRRLTISKLELKVMATTKAVAESLSKIGFNELKIKTLPLVVDEQFLKFKEEKRCKVRENYGFTEDDFVVTYFGGCNPKKGVLELVSVAPMIRKKITLFKMLLLLRPPSSKDYLYHVKQRILENKCRDYVIVVNKLLELNDLINILTFSDMVVLPFKYLDDEPPLTLLEAMTLGKVVITTNIGPTKYIVGEDRGVILTHLSQTTITDAIYNIYKNESRRHYIERNAKNFARTNFVNWHTLANIVERELLIDSL